jgi:non-heme chloroperoxidase
VDNAEGALPQATVGAIQQAVLKDRFAFLTSFFKEFYNLGTFLGSRVSEEAVGDS